MDVSVVLVSRNRPQMLIGLLNSLKANSELTYDVHIGFDLDDLTSNYCWGLGLFDGDNIKTYWRERTNNLQKYLNFLATQTTGDYIFGLNDDCIIQTRGWDRKIREGLDKNGPACYGVTKDNSIDRVSGDYAAFPIVSRAAFMKLGFFMDDRCENHGADVVTHRIYKEAGLAFPVDLNIRHLLHETPEALQKRQEDKTATDMIERTFSNENIHNIFTTDITPYVRKLLGQE